MTSAAAPVPSGKRERRIAALLRRADHLEARIAAAAPEKQLTYDVREAHALRWAIHELEAIHQRSPS